MFYKDNFPFKQKVPISTDLYEPLTVGVTTPLSPLVDNSDFQNIIPNATTADTSVPGAGQELALAPMIDDDVLTPSVHPTVGLDVEPLIVQETIEATD